MSCGLSVIMNTTLYLIFILVCISINVVQSKLYSTLNNKKYYIEDKYSYNWYQAHLECSARDMALITIDSKEKYDDIYHLLTNGTFAHKPPHLWVGAVGFQRKFAWVLTGKPIIPSLWCNICPNDNPKNENCVQFWGNERGLNDLNCDAHCGFVCEDRVPANIFEKKYENMIINLIQRN